jgi:putative phosphoribosyl transferase
MQFRDRRDAGRQLALTLRRYAGRADVVVLALPRGGVPVAYEVATALGVPLDVFVVRKLGLPGHEELAMGAIATGDVMVLNEEVMRLLDIPGSVIAEVRDREARELARREALYRDGRPPLEVRGRTVLLVDDGLATGASMRAAIEALRQRSPARIVVAVPIAAVQTCADLRHEVEEVVCAVTPEPFHAVGLWYQDFSPVSDDEVRELSLLASAAGTSERPAG